MPTDAEIIRHLAEKVMGWSIAGVHGGPDGFVVARKDTPQCPLVFWNPLESIADCMEVQAVVLAGEHGDDYADEMHDEAFKSLELITTASVTKFLLSVPPRVRALAMYRKTGGAE